MSKGKTSAVQNQETQSNHWPFPATDLTSLLKLVNRLPREKPNAIRTITVKKITQFEDAPL